MVYGGKEQTVAITVMKGITMRLLSANHLK